MLQTTDPSKDFFNELHLIRLNIIKEAFEILGCDLGETEPNVVYHNYLDNSNIGNFIGGYNEYADSFEDEPGNLSNYFSKVRKILGGTSTINNVAIPDSVKKNQKFGKCPNSFVTEVTKASKITGVPVDFYIAYGALESGWRNVPTNSAGYGGYFGQRKNEGGVGSLFEQAQGKIVSIYRSAMKDAQNLGIGTDTSDLIAWCYLCYNAGNAGAKTMYKALGNKLRHTDINAYRNAAQAYVNKYWSHLSSAKQTAQVEEKTLAIPKAYYIASQVLTA